MFELGKKDENSEERVDSGPASVGQSRPTNTATASARSDCAVIGQSIRIDGDLRGDEDLRIEGDVSGTVELTSSNLTIGREGKVRADVFAKSIVVDGTTKGDLYASERVNIHVNARVQGNITAPMVGIEEGAHFKGSIEMDQKAVDKALQKVMGDKSNGGKADARAGKTVGAAVAPKKAVDAAAPNAVHPAGAA